MQRRQFLRATLATVAGWGLGCGDSDAPAREVTDGHELFPQSVASGDPRPGSLIVWTRVELEGDDVEVELELFSDAELTTPAVWDDGPRQAVIASIDHDHCVKLRVAGLEPDTEYWYRFVVEQDGAFRGSQVGRARTAPAADSDRAVRFAFVSCQDFGGRYYNAYADMQRHELDFVVHLGDYVYETAGDEGFQGGTAERNVTFEDTAGALVISRGDGSSFEAAKSLANYRQLYKVFRSDVALQRAHARWPMLVIWDDHEFSDDCWGATATYNDGRSDETDIDRRRAANQAWFEYMPVDYDDPQFEYDPAAMPPDDIRIWRDFVFGKHVHVVLTDLRTHRSDHLIPEDAYPGTVVLTDAQLEASGGPLPDAGVYIADIDALDGGSYAEVLRAAAREAAYPEDRVTGAISAGWINSVLEDTGSTLAPIDLEEPTLPRGLAYVDLLKGSLWSRIGSRYLVARDAFTRWASVRYQETAGASEQAMGEAQQQWFLDTMKGSSSTWKVWGNEFCLMPLQIDLQLLSVPPSFQRIFHLNVDDWNGMGNRRDALLSELSTVPNVVAITGDIHAFFAGTPSVSTDESKKIVELVVGSVSSGTLQELLQSQVATDPVLMQVNGAQQLAGAIRDLLQLASGPNAHLAHADVVSHGYAVVEADGATLQTTFYAHAAAEAMVEHYDDPDLAGLFTETRFKVDAGAPELFQDFGGTWRRWDSATRAWV
ncbi:MAG: alkaline phosphatase D family protein [Deltaproteobacteria bacterium]|nr:alkaline phosphatase D family protein [Nannocystaceae bacterium]